MKMNRIIEGHVLDVLREMPEKSIDMIITSPPYWGLRSYSPKEHHTVQIWDSDPECEHQWSEIIVKKKRGKSNKDSSWKRPSRKANATNKPLTSYICSKCGAFKGSLGHEFRMMLYIKHLVDIFRECKRVLADYGTLWVNIGDTFYGSGTAGKDTGKSGIPTEAFPHVRPNQGYELPKTCLSLIPERFALSMIDDGWILRNRLIWEKPSAMPESINMRFTIDHELIYFFVKNRKYYFKQQLEPISRKNRKNIKKKWGKVGGEKYTNSPEEVIVNEKYSGKDVSPSIDRNKRCVWRINPKPMSHKLNFATFPQDLLKVPIDAGCPKLVCTECGEPQKPIIEKVPTTWNENIYERRLISWKKCECNAPFRRGRVLDIFIGTGTTALEAIRQNVDWLGIEIVPEFIEYAKQRIDTNQIRLTDFLK